VYHQVVSIPHIPKQIEGASHSRPSAGTTDARRLLQLGLALGIVYLLFLIAWFWGTRGRRHGVGRMVRF